MNPPKLTSVEARLILEKLAPKHKGDRLVVLAIRGYYRDSMGRPGQNDRNIYDDAVFVVTPNRFRAFNFNTDPSPLFRKHTAALKPGVWLFGPKKHKIASPLGYAAFGQYEPVTVIRDGEGEDTGTFGINLHKGGIMGTGSEGCQTVPPAQWESFRDMVLSILGVTVKQVLATPFGAFEWEFPYVLVTREQCEAIGIRF